MNDDNDLIALSRWHMTQEQRDNDPDYMYFECHCMCHGHKNVMHIMACCDNGWKKIKKVTPNAN